MVLIVGIEYTVELVLNGGVGLQIVLKNEIGLLGLNQTLSHHIVSRVKIIHCWLLMGVFLFGRDGVVIVAAIFENLRVVVWDFGFVVVFFLIFAF
jgi:hypothetical protein